jgi:hypothetical protein
MERRKVRGIYKGLKFPSKVELEGSIMSEFLCINLERAAQV